MREKVMQHKLIFTTILIIFHSLLFISNSQAQWSTTPDTAIYLGQGEPVGLIKDEKGGAYLGYYSGDLVVNRVDKFGYLQWNPPISAVKQSVPPYWQYEGSIASGDDGSIFAATTEVLPVTQFDWEERVWVNKLDSTGTKLWGNNGVRVSLDNLDNRIPRIISDQNGGCYVTYKQGTSIYIQHFDSLGTRLFGNSSLQLNTIPSNTSTDLDLIKTSDGCIVLTGLGYSRIDSSGLVWFTNVPSGSQFGLGVVGATGDGSDGVVCLGQYGNNQTQTIDAISIRVDSSGSFVWNNFTNLGGIPWGGVEIYEERFIQRNFNNSFSNFWSFKFPDSSTGSNTYNLNVQANSLDGNLLNSFYSPILNSTGRIVQGLIKSNNLNNLFFWTDDTTPNRIGFVQMMDLNGNKLWGNNGQLFTNKTFSLVKSLSDTRGGAILLWSGINGMLWLQQISRHGNLGEILNDYGDLNEDGVIDTLDSQIVLNSVVGTDTLTQNQFEVGDVDGDGKVKVNDASLILQKAKGLIKEFPIHELEE
ncbi:MAG: hypothetical protein DWQ06_07775 [Calditrichaeota bacterium]|nr:MAG: hypothetical protein DWQ06_07775 [Calditrichota bacterium]